MPSDQDIINLAHTISDLTALVSRQQDQINDLAKSLAESIERTNLFMSDTTDVLRRLSDAVFPAWSQKGTDK